MARSAPKSKKARPGPKSKKPVEEVEETEQAKDDYPEDDDAQTENNGNKEDDAGESEEEEPPSKKGRGKAKAGKKPAAKKGGRASSRARKTPAAKKEESEDEDEEDDKEYEVQSILNHRNRKGAKEYLVKWKGYRVNQSTWEPEKNLNCDEIIAEYEEKLKEEKAKPAVHKELREGRKQTERYAEIAGSGHDHMKRHSRRNTKSPRKSYRENPDSD